MAQSKGALATNYVWKANQYLKVLEASSRCFKNWLPLSIELLRGTGNEYQVRSRKGAQVRMSRRLLWYILSVAYERKVRQLQIDNSEIVVNGVRFEPLEKNVYLKLLLKSGWTIENDYICKDGIKFGLEDEMFSIFETFETGQYDISVTNREVVDVGANVGDSPIFFVMNGAAHVFAFEPIPNIYSKARRNIELNLISDKVTIENAAIGGVDGEAMVPTSIPIDRSFAFSLLKGINGDAKIPVFSLHSVIKRVKDPYLLKMDCEGSEYEIIMRDYESVRKFERVALEYHSFRNSLRDIEKKLSNDFNLKRREIPLCDPHLEGLLYCERKPNVMH